MKNDSSLRKSDKMEAEKNRHDRHKLGISGEQSPMATLTSTDASQDGVHRRPGWPAGTYAHTMRCMRSVPD